MERALKWTFCALVLALAFYQFSEDTADPDLWGHALFGQQFLKTGVLEKAEPYSWTAPGYPWINHEVGSEIALGAAHQWMGGNGIFILKVAVGLAAFLMALRLGANGLTWPSRGFAWALGAVAVVEISFGFAPRPQIFTALALVCQLWLLKRIHTGSLLSALALPVLFAVWINTHGGALAGVGLLGLTAGATTIHFLIKRFHSAIGGRLDDSGNARVVVILWFSLAAVFGAMLINPWGMKLIQWLIGSVLWLRPEIEEWNPTPLNWDHAALFIVVGITVFSWAFSRRRKALWEIFACAAFALLALRSVRNTPLFCLTALALVPVHFVDALERFRESFARLEQLAASKVVQKTGPVVFAFAALAILIAAFTFRKDHRGTIEVPKKQYPVAAVDFIRQKQLKGNLFVFFDWGEMCIWELPDCLVSVDGRLDTCYPRELIKAHWQVYNAQPHDPAALNLARADFALLPANLAGAVALSKQPGWQAAYFDEVAVVLVRDVNRFPGLANIKLPIEGSADAARGKAAFPNEPSLRVARTKTP